MKIPQHLEVRSPKFEIDDLKKLIKSTTQDLEEADRKRRDDFKRYEMEKKFEKEERLKHIEDEEKRKAEQDRYRNTAIITNKTKTAKAKPKNYPTLAHFLTWASVL